MVRLVVVASVVAATGVINAGRFEIGVIAESNFGLAEIGELVVVVGDEAMEIA